MFDPTRTSNEVYQSTTNNNRPIDIQTQSSRTGFEPKQEQNTTNPGRNSIKLNSETTRKTDKKNPVNSGNIGQKLWYLA